MSPRAAALRAQAAGWRAVADALDLEAEALEGAEQPAPAVAAYMTAPAFAEHVGMSRTTVFGMLKRGLPCVGEGRARRVDVERAVAWMREERDQVDDALEREARASARAAANGTPRKRNGATPTKDAAPSQESTNANATIR